MALRIDRERELARQHLARKLDLDMHRFLRGPDFGAIVRLVGDRRRRSERRTDCREYGEQYETARQERSHETHFTKCS